MTRADRIHYQRQFSHLIKRAQKYRWKLMLGGLILGVALGIGIFRFMHAQTAHAWWDTNWSFRQKVPVTNTSGSSQTNFQIQLTIDTATLVTAGKLQSDCDDLRFTDQGGKSLSYWLEPNTCNTATTLVWVKVPSIPTSGADVYYYYGNPTASSESTTQKTFISEINGAAAAWPLDDTTTTQSYARVTNPAVSSGRELIINGGMDSDTIWSKGGAAWTIANGVASANAAAANTALGQNFTGITPGKAYQITFTLSNYTSGNVRPEMGSAGTVRSANGTYTETLVATTATFRLNPQTTFTGDIDNVSVTQLNTPPSSGTATELLADGTMEAAGTSSWTAANSAVLSKQTGTPYAGSQVLRVAGTAAFAISRQTILTSGQTYRVSGYARSDGTVLPRVSAGTSAVFVGTTSTSWQPFDAVFVANGTNFDLQFSTTATGYVEFDNVTVTLDTNIRPGELVQDGTMETSGTGNWLSTNGAVLTKQTTTQHGGNSGQVLRVAVGVGNSPYASQSNLVIGKTYRVTGWGRSSGNSVQLWGVGFLTNGGLFSGTNSTSWQFFDFTAVAQSTSLFMQQLGSTAGDYAEFDDISVTEVSPLVGKMTPTATTFPTIGSTAGGHLSNAYTFDGTNDFVNIYSSDLNSVFYQNEGTVVAWAKVNASSVWTDSTSGQIFYLRADDNNRIQILESSSNSLLQFNYLGGGTNSQVISAFSSTSWFQVVATWNKSADQFKVYVNGAQVGTTQTGLGTWTGNLATTTSLIGAASTAGAAPWKGMINDVRLYTRALSAEEIAAQYSSSTDIQAYNSSNYLSKELLRKYNAGVTVGAFGTEEVGADPVAYWKLDDGQGQTTQDSTVNNNDGTLGVTSGSATDDPTWTTEDQCVSGKCLKFDGTNDYAQVANNTSLQLTRFTVSFWMKAIDTPSGTTQAVLVRGASTGQVNYGFYWDHSNSTFRKAVTFYNGSSYVTAQIASTMNTNQWYHVTGTYDGASLKVYLNGNLDTTTSSVSTPSTGGGFKTFIGANNSNDSPSGYFKGYVDEPRIYNYARSAIQVKEDFNRGAATLGTKNQTFLSNGLITYLKFDENTGSTSTDSTGNGRTATLTGTAGWRSGKFGAGLDTTGANNSHAYIADNTDYDNLTKVTWSTWAYIDASTGSNQHLMSRYGTTGSTENYLILSSGLIPSFRIVVGSTEYTATATSAVTATAWHHFVGTYDGETVRLYADGVLVATNETPSGNVNMSTAVCFGIGGRVTNGADCTASTSSVNGAFDETRIYNRALSADEVRALYGYATGPVGYWKFDENTGTTASDMSGNGNTGTLTLGPTWTTGKYGSGISFDGTDDYITAPSTTSLVMTNSSVSVSAWIYPTTALATQGIAGKPNGSVYGYGLSLAGGNIRLNTRSGNAGSVVDCDSTTVPPINTWSFVEGTISDPGSGSITQNIYLNGILVKTCTAASRVGDSATAFNIGATNGGASNRFSGKIDDVKIYNYARTPTQILEDMGGDTAPSVSGNVLPDPLAYYKFNEQQGQTTNNSGIGGGVLNGTLGVTSGSSTDDPTWKNKESCKAEGCLSFDGGDYAAVPNNAALQITDNLSISAWVKLSNTNVSQYIVNKRSGESGYGLLIDSSNRAVLVTGSSSYGSGAAAGVSLADGAWHYIVGTYDNATRRVYVDGNLQYTSAVSGQLTGGGTIEMRIGRASDASGGSSYFSGSVDELKVYSTALTADQVMLDMNAGAALNFGTTANSEASILSDGAGTAPVAEWKFEEKTGTSAFDTSGSGNTGTLGGSPTWTTGKYGSAVKFSNSTAQSISLGNILNFGSSDSVTFEAWINREVAGTQDTILSKSNNCGSTSQGFCLFLLSDLLKVSVSDGTNTYTLTTTNTIGIDNWIHVAGVIDRSSTNTAIYINGVKQTVTTSGTLASVGSLTSSTTALIGLQGGSVHPFSGKIDELKVYNYARTPAQVAYDYNRGAPVAQWKLDECQDSTANDSSGFGNSGAITIGGTGTQTSVGTCGTSSTAWGNGSTGRFGGSLNFDGTDDYVADTTLSHSLSADMTLSGWFKAPSAPSSTQRRMFTLAASAGDGVQLCMATNGTVGIDNTGGPTSNVFTSSSKANGSWHHAVVTRSGTTYTLYVDGVSIGTSGGSATTYTRLFAGTNSTLPSTQFFPGQLDDIRVYNYSLSAAQIQQVFNGGSVRFQ